MTCRCIASNDANNSRQQPTYTNKRVACKSCICWFQSLNFKHPWRCRVRCSCKKNWLSQSAEGRLAFAFTRRLCPKLATYTSVATTTLCDLVFCIRYTIIAESCTPIAASSKVAKQNGISLIDLHPFTNLISSILQSTMSMKYYVNS